MRHGQGRGPRGPVSWKPALYASLIVLSVVLTLAGEALIVAHAPWSWRRALSWCLAALDLFFTVVSSAQGARSLSEGRLGSWLRERAWIDLPAAILPLIFTTGPFLFDASFGIKETTTLVALGNFRLLRGLGLLRSLRLLHFFRRVESERPAALALCASLLVFIVAEASSIAGFWPDAHAALLNRREATMKALSAVPGADNAEAIARVDADLLLVRHQGLVIYTRYSSEEYLRHFAPDEIGYLRRPGGVEAFFSLVGELRAEAAMSLVSSLSALAALAALAWGLSRRERRGLAEWAVPGEPGSGPRPEGAGHRDLEGDGPGRGGAGSPAGPEELAALLDDQEGPP